MIRYCWNKISYAPIKERSNKPFTRTYVQVPYSDVSEDMHFVSRHASVVMRFTLSEPNDPVISV